MTDNIARYIDHAVLRPEMTREEAEQAVKYGIDNGVRTVCVRPCDIEMAAELCEGSQTGVCCVLAFPHGCVPREVKAFEALNYCGKGINELDMVINYGFVKSGLWSEIRDEINAVAEITKKSGVILKTIFETCTLTVAEITRATEIAIEAGAGFIKTSTGFHNNGATVEAVKTMLDAAGGRIRVKASGGIRDFVTAVRYIEMGCERLGVGYATTPVLIEGKGKSENSY